MSIPSERRKEIRRSAEGTVLLRPLEAHPPVVRAELCDISDSGFRASHHCMSIRSGDTLFYEHQHQKGMAKVVWTFIQGDHVESGFLLIPA